MDDRTIEELGSKLKPNHKIFCDEWLKDRNGSRAYKVAYETCKKESTAGVNASKLLGTTKIKAYIEARLDILSNEAGVTVKRILKEEATLAFSDLRKLFDGETTISPDKLPEDVARSLAGIEVNEITSPDGEKTVKYKYKFWDKGQALSRLEKHLGMYERDNAQKTHEGLGGPAEQLLSLIREVRSEK